MSTAKEVANWMHEQFGQNTYLYQEDVVWKIKQQFGADFVYDNENGNLAISKSVLREFRKLTEEDAVWERGARCWRKRNSIDGSGRSVE